MSNVFDAIFGTKIGRDIMLGVGVAGLAATTIATLGASAPADAAAATALPAAEAGTDAVAGSIGDLSVAGSAAEAGTAANTAAAAASGSVASDAAANTVGGGTAVAVPAATNAIGTTTTTPEALGIANPVSTPITNEGLTTANAIRGVGQGVVNAGNDIYQEQAKIQQLEQQQPPQQLGQTAPNMALSSPQLSLNPMFQTIFSKQQQQLMPIEIPPITVSDKKLKTKIVPAKRDITTFLQQLNRIR